MYCHNCGKQIPDSTKFCRYCGASQSVSQNAPPPASPPRTRPAQPQPAPQPTPQPASRQTAGQGQESVLSGIFGAFLGSLAGVAVMMLLNKLGYVSSVSGVVMLACAVWGYAHFGKELSKKGIVLSVLVVIVMIYVGNRLYWAMAMPGSTLENFSQMTELLEWYRLEDAYYESLTQQYGFAAVGGIFLGVSLLRGNRAAKKK